MEKPDFIKCDCAKIRGPHGNIQKDDVIVDLPIVSIDGVSFLMTEVTDFDGVKSVIEAKVRKAGLPDSVDGDVKMVASFLKSVKLPFTKRSRG